ncbi:uncharacterized protein LOC119600021 [Lucilia sericata]|uniref:uncharacterized protein LOC119600021 n=1 Tax=Lucilia sericata TaxID=13632 RepID=UPI0018A82262|nr:uncharacterized protein LOC119600021 [Lucilia sericata]
MKMKFIWFIIMVFQVSVTVVAATATASTITPITTTSIHDKHFKEFIEQIENLVLNTTKQALQVTTHVYRNLTKSMSPLLQQAIAPITTEYLRMVEQTLTCPSNYSEQRKLLRYFRYNNLQIERLRLQLQPQHPKFEFHLISNDFYYAGKNLTEFDNLYLEFMQQFQRLSQTLWDTMSEEVVEQQQDLLEILDEIAKEKELSEKDKLYDEFIEMFLFKTEMDTIENRELE